MKAVLRPRRANIELLAATFYGPSVSRISAPDFPACTATVGDHKPVRGIPSDSAADRSSDNAGLALP